MFFAIIPVLHDFDLGISAEEELKGLNLPIGYFFKLYIPGNTNTSFHRRLTAASEKDFARGIIHSRDFIQGTIVIDFNDPPRSAVDPKIAFQSEKSAQNDRQNSEHLSATRQTCVCSRLWRCKFDKFYSIV